VAKNSDAKQHGPKKLTEDQDNDDADATGCRLKANSLITLCDSTEMPN